MTNPVMVEVAMIGEQSLGLDDVVIHAYLREQHELRTTTTQYPVESGAEVTEHAVRRPVKLRLEGWVASRRQVPAPQDFGLPTIEVDHAVPVRSWEKIAKALDEHTVMKVVTLLGVYPNMTIRKATAQVDRRTGQNLPFVVELEEVQLSPSVSGIGEDSPDPDGAAADRGGDTSTGVKQTEARGTFTGNGPGTPEEGSAPVSGNTGYGVDGNEVLGL